MNPDDKICYCFHISKRKILNFIRIHQPRRASQISECGGAGTGCGWCVPFLKKYYQEYQQHSADNALEMQEDLTPEEYAQARTEYIRAGKGTPPASSRDIDDRTP